MGFVEMLLRRGNSRQALVLGTHGSLVLFGYCTGLFMLCSSPHLLPRCAEDAVGAYKDIAFVGGAIRTVYGYVVCLIIDARKVLVQ